MRNGTLEYDRIYRPQSRGYLSGPDAESYEDLSMFCGALRMLKHAAERILGYEDPRPGEPDEDAWVAALAEARGHHWALQASLARLDSSLLGGVEGFLEDVHFERLERKEGREAPAPRAAQAEDDQGDDDTPLETAAERAAGVHPPCTPEPAEVETPGAPARAARPTRWLDPASPNRAYHIALRDYVAALQVLQQAVEMVQELDPDGYATQRELTQRLGWRDGEDFGGLGDAWAAAVECCGAVGPLVSNWLIPHVEGFLFGDIDSYGDECMREEDEHARRAWAQMTETDEDSDQPTITVARNEEVSA